MKQQTTFAAVLAAGLSISAAHAETTTVAWARKLDFIDLGPGKWQTIPQRIVIDRAGAPLFIGTYSNDSCHPDGSDACWVGWLVKLQADGTVAWQQGIGQSTSSHFSRLSGGANTADGSAIVVGDTRTEDASPNLAVQAGKFDLRGFPLWLRAFPRVGSGRVILSGIDARGSAYIAIAADGTTLEGATGSLSKLNSSGDLLWQRAVDAPVRAVTGGAGDSFISSGRILMKVLNNNQVAWQRQTPLACAPREIDSITIDQKGNAIVINDADPGYYVPQLRPCLAKYSSAGKLLWVQPGGQVTGIDQLGNVFVLAGHNLRKIGPGGLPSWAITLDVYGAIGLVRTDRQGNTFSAYEAGGGVLTVTKYGPNGAAVWTQASDLAGQTRGNLGFRDIATDANGNVYVALTDAWDTGWDSAWGVKFAVQP